MDSKLEKLKAIFPIDDIKKYNYSPMLGIYPSKINLYTEFIHDMAKIYFQIIDKYNLDYSVFAGQSVGMIRNKKNCPWIDDYDMIILTEAFEKFEQIAPIFIKNGFVYNCANKNSLMKVWSNNKRKYGKFFEMDIFYSSFNDKNMLINMGSWGFYTRKIPRDVVLPFVRHQFHDDLNLPFFNNYIEEVNLVYGDVLKECVLSSHDFDEKIVYDDWKEAYADFDYVKEKSIFNTILNININKDYKSINKLTISKNDNRFTNELDILKYINVNNIGFIYIFDEKFLFYIIGISYYFPEMIIEYFEYEQKTSIIHCLNYVNKLHVKDEILFNFYNDPDIVYLNKPKIDLIKLITFGTFDLFHIGHENVFKKCAEYSDNIICGISSDRFTFEKKNIIPTDSFETRKQNVLRCKNVKQVFSEESMDKKNEYIKTYDANILIMGDDWINKFDWVDCCVIYINRTPNISSTMLREKLKN